MRLDLIVLADLANVDAVGKFNIVGEFNAIYARELPTSPVNISLVARIVAESSEGEEHAISVALVDQDGKELARIPDQPLRFARAFPGSTGDLRALVIIGMRQVQFQAYGPFSFHVLVDGRFLGERTVYVLARPDSPATQSD